MSTFLKLAASLACLALTALASVATVWLLMGCGFIR